MDGVQELVGVTIVAATNRPEIIVCLILCASHGLGATQPRRTHHAQDSALMRPGRLDRILYVGPPDQQGREEILRIRTRKMSVEPGMDVSELARLVRAPFLIACAAHSSDLTLAHDARRRAIPVRRLLHSARRRRF